MQKHETAKHREYSLKLLKFHFLQQLLKNLNFILLSQSIRGAFEELQDVLRAFETKEKEIEQSYHMFSCHFMQNFLNENVRNFYESKLHFNICIEIEGYNNPRSIRNQ